MGGDIYIVYSVYKCTYKYAGPVSLVCCYCFNDASSVRLSHISNCVYMFKYLHRKRTSHESIFYF